MSPFAPASAAALDHPGRLRLVPVERLLDVLAPRKGLRFLDVGCGTGTFFFPLFERVQGEGVFLAAELQEEMLRLFFNRLEAYSEHPGFKNIEVVRAKPMSLPLPDASADLVLVSHVWHEIPRRPAYLRELKRLLSPGGTLGLLDWRTVEEEPGMPRGEERMGPPFEHRVSEAEAVAGLQDAGFQFVVSHGGFEQNWCLTARKGRGKP